MALATAAFGSDRHLTSTFSEPHNEETIPQRPRRVSNAQQLSSSTRRPSILSRRSTLTNRVDEHQHPSEPIIVRAPKPTPGFLPPSVEWLSRNKFHIAYSTLPIWKGKRNVTITYTPLPMAKGQTGLPRMEDLVEYQEGTRDKVKSVKGIDMADPGGDSSGWNWRGCGIIKIASSRWEILGWGGPSNDGSSTSDVDAKMNAGLSNGVNGHAAIPSESVEWAVTFFFKTAFTPAGMNIYSRSADGLPPQLVRTIRQMLAQNEDPVVRQLSERLYPLQTDDARGSVMSEGLIGRASAEF